MNRQRRAWTGQNIVKDAKTGGVGGQKHQDTIGMTKYNPRSTRSGRERVRNNRSGKKQSRTTWNTAGVIKKHRETTKRCSDEIKSTIKRLQEWWKPPKSFEKYLVTTEKQHDSSRSNRDRQDTTEKLLRIVERVTESHERATKKLLLNKKSSRGNQDVTENNKRTTTAKNYTIWVHINQMPKK